MLAQPEGVLVLAQFLVDENKLTIGVQKQLQRVAAIDTCLGVKSLPQFYQFDKRVPGFSILA